MKKLVFFLSVLCLVSVAAIPDLGNMQKDAEAAVQKATELEGLKQLVRAITPIQFKVGSSELSLNDPSYKIAGYDVNTLMKDIVIPGLSDVVNKLPADKKVTIIGHANRTGSENGSGSFIGNMMLSQKRAQAVLAYIQANSSLAPDRFMVQGKGSSMILGGKDPADPANCRVSFDIQ